MEIGIVGLPNVGKSTLFNALTSGRAAASNYPFTTIEPNVGIVNVPDSRLARLTELFKPEKVTPAVIKFVDIAGLVQGASEGAGLGNKFLSHIREVDAIVQVLRVFSDADVIHTLGGVDPKRDAEVIETELILADLQSVEKQLEKTGKDAKSGDKEAKARLEVLEKIKQVLNQGQSARLSDISQEDLKSMALLSSKPVLFLGNVDESQIASNGESSILEKIAASRNAKWVIFSGKLEAELNQLSTEEERESFRAELGVTETGLEKLIRESYQLLDLITFLTAGPKEVRGWTLERGSTAVEAAGKIHSDIARGFIKADIYKFSDLDRLGSEKAIQEAGMKRSEGRDYVMQDGDVCYFHFRVA